MVVSEPAADHRVAMVTGGATGIGRACVLAFAQAGMDVVVADLKTDAAEQTAREAETFGARALALQCDVTREASVRDAVAVTDARFARLDVLVTAAGIDLHKPLIGTGYDEWGMVLGVNLGGGFLAIKHAAPVMIRNGYGRIVCIGSTAGIRGMGHAAYSASKAGLLGLVRSAVRELSASGITLNVVAPGPTETPLTDALWRATPGRRERLVSAVPVGRVADPAEIAGAVAFLVSDNGGFVNGAEIVVDGGMTAVVRLP